MHSVHALARSQTLVARVTVAPVEKVQRQGAVPRRDLSWELRTGLQVKEGLAADLPLHGWLEGWLQLVGAGGGASLSLISR